MKIFNPFIFNINKSITIKKNDCGFSVHNIFQTPEKIINFLKDDLVYQNSKKHQGAAPLYRSVLKFFIPGLTELVSKVLHEAYGIVDIISLECAANIQPKEILDLRLNSFPHIDTSDFTFIIYFRPTATLVWETTEVKKLVRQENYLNYVNTDSFPNENEIYKKYLDKVHKVIGEFNSGFLLEASKYRHSIDYWDDPNDNEDRITLSLFIRTKR